MTYEQGYQHGYSGHRCPKLAGENAELVEYLRGHREGYFDWIAGLPNRLTGASWAVV
jgi:hypothetical protein